VAALTQILEDNMRGYAGEALNGYSYLTKSADDSVYTIVSVGHIQGRHFVETGLIARIIGRQIVIELDLNDKPLVDALLEAGVPRQQIVLAYAGEPLPAAS